MPFIAIDGCDGSGKTTQCDMLAALLRRTGADADPLIISHPTHDGLGGLLRRTLHKEKQRFDPWAETFLYAADIAQTAQQVIKPRLAAGRWVLAHRWWYSSVVYQAAIDGCDWDAVRDISRAAASGLVPDVSIILMAKPETAMARIGARGEDIVSPYENLPHLQAAYDGFDRLRGDKYAETLASPDDGVALAEVVRPLWYCQTDDATPEQVHESIVSTLATCGFGGALHVGVA